MFRVSKWSRRVGLARIYLDMQVRAFLESYNIVCCIMLYYCAQRSRISLTPIGAIHCAIFQANVWTSGRRRVDCIAHKSIILNVKHVLIFLELKSDIHPSMYLVDFDAIVFVSFCIAVLVFLFCCP